MSDVQLDIGKAKRVQADKVGFLECVKAEGLDLSLCYEDDEYVDVDGYFWIKNKQALYKITEHQALEPYDDICQGSVDESGEISFVLQYYNGGTCFEEMFEDLLENLKEIPNPTEI